MMSSKYFPLVTFWITWTWNWGFRTIIPVLLPSIRSSLSLPISLTATLPSVLFLGYYSVAYLSSILSVRLGRKNVICSGILLTSVSMLLLSLAPPYPILLLLIFLIGIGLGTYIPSAISLLSDIFPMRTGTFLGIHQTGALVGRSVGPLFVWLLLTAIKWNGIIQLWIVPGVAALIALFILIQERPIALEHETSCESEPIKRRWSLSLYIPLFVVSIGICTASPGLLSIVPTYMVISFRLKDSFVALLMGVANVVGTAGVIAFGFLSDRFGRMIVIFVLMIIITLSSLGIALMPFGPLFVIAMAALPMSSTTFFGVLAAFVSDYSLPNKRASTYASIISVAGVFGAGVAPIVIGFLADHFSFQYALLYPILIELVGCCSAGLLMKKLLKDLEKCNITVCSHN